MSLVDSAAVTFTVLRSTSPNGPWTTLVSGITSTTYVDQTVVPGQIYFYEIQASNAFGSSTPSAPVSATPTTVTPPGVPTSFTIAAQNGGAQLQWNPPSTGSPPSVYYIYRADLGTSVYQQTSTTGYVDGGLTNGTTYTYTVAAVNSAGVGPQTAGVSVTPSSSSTTPSQPLSPSATTGQPTSIPLSWTPPSSNGGSAITSYNVYLGTTAGGESGTPYATGISPTATTYTVTGLTNVTHYYLTIAAVNANGVGTESVEVSATPSATTVAPPGAPQNLTATSGVTASIPLAWNAPTTGGPVVSYNVFRGTAAGNYSLTPIGNTTSRTYSDTTVTAGTTYHYVVEAVNSGGSSPNSNDASAASATGGGGGGGGSGGKIYVGPSWIGNNSQATTVCNSLGLNLTTETVITNNNFTINGWPGIKVFAENKFNTGNTSLWTSNAQQCVANGIHIVRLAWEFNDGGNPGVSDSGVFLGNPSGFIARWQQIYNTYNAVSPGWFSFIFNPDKGTAASNYYPGKAYMGNPGVVGIDMYTTKYCPGGTGQIPCINSYGWSPKTVLSLALANGHEIAWPEWSNRPNSNYGGPIADDSAYIGASMDWAASAVQQTGRNVYMGMWSWQYGRDSSAWVFENGTNSMATLASKIVQYRNAGLMG